MFKRVSLLLFSFLYVIMLKANDINRSFSLQWSKPVVEKITEEIQHTYIYFKGACLFTGDDYITPEFVETFTLTDGNVSAIVTIENAVWQSLSTQELNLIDKNLINEEININTKVTYTQKKPFLQVRFFPFRKKVHN